MSDAFPDPSGVPRPPSGGGRAGGDHVRPTARSFGTLAPPLVMALVLLVAGALVLVGMLVAMATFSTDGLGPGSAFGNRIRAGTDLIAAPLVLLVPLALLLLHHQPAPTDERAGPPGSDLPYLLSVAAAALSGAFAVFLLLRLVVNLFEGGEASVRSVLLFTDLAALIVVLGSLHWALFEVRRSRELSGPAWEPPSPSAGSDWRSSPPAASPGSSPPADWRPAPADPGWSDRPPIWPHQPPPQAPPRQDPPRPRSDDDDRPWSPPPL